MYTVNTQFKCIVDYHLAVVKRTMYHLTRFAALIIGLCLTQVILGQFDLRLGPAPGGGIRGDIGWTRHRSRFSIGASFDANRNWSGYAGFAWRFRRAVKDFQSFNVKFMADPCKFDFYDQDKDGSISNAELWSVFGNTTEANMLFNALNKGKVDDTISKDEFVTLAPLLIDDCFQKMFEGAKNGQ